MQENPNVVDPALGFVEKLRVLAACGVSIVLLWTLGWQLARPTDPLMALTLSRSGASMLALWPALAILAAVSAAIGTAIMGRRLPEVGVLAAAVGIAVMALRGGTMQVLLGYEAGTTAETRRALMMSLALDCVLWTGIMAVAWLVMLVVRNWLWPAIQPPDDNAVEISAGSIPPRSKAAPVSKSATRTARSQAMGAAALAITAVVALFVIWNTISSTPVAMVQPNQVVASVAGGLFLGAMAARYCTGVTEPLWYVLAPPIVGLAGFILGYVSSDMSWAQSPMYDRYVQLATTPPHDLVRPLPVLYITVGIAGALGGFWTADRMERMAQQESS